MDKLENGNKIGEWLHRVLVDLGLSNNMALAVKVVLLALIVVFISYIVNVLTKKFLVSSVERLIRKTKSTYDDVFIEHRVIRRLSHLAPAVVIYLLSSLVLKDFPMANTFVRESMLVYIVIAVVWSIDAFFNAIHDIYNRFPYASERPIKGYIQVLKMVFYSFAILSIVSIIFKVSLIAVFTGLGAIAAVLLLVFKDTILGFTAGIQLSANRMLRVGDWISMPSHKADGTVLEVTLNTVKVQNWDKTISTIPTYAMVTNSFMNWRGMEESGGRRIKRSLNIDMKSVHFASDELLAKCKKIEHLKVFVAEREIEIEAYNKEIDSDTSIKVNGRRMTNLGLFRHYVERYLKSHSKIHQDLTLLVRHLQPTEKGLPIEVYAFCNDQAWGNYEAIQADVFDHLLAVLPEFELEVFQFSTQFTPSSF